MEKQVAINDVLDLTKEDVRTLKITTRYCVTQDVHDGQMKLSCARGLPAVEPAKELRYEAVAVVCSGPSLQGTWEEIKPFKQIISCSGAHDFLISRGIIPTYHMEADPRKHKAVFVAHPHLEVEYLIASCCHSAVFDALKGFNVKLWHTLGYDGPDLIRCPRGHWALTGGSNVGMRALVMARVLGFTTIHVFGMDCCSKGAFHANDHPNEPKDKALRRIKIADREYVTTEVFLHYAKEFFRETMMLPDCQFLLHGDGMLQHMVAQRLTDPVLREKDIQEKQSYASKASAIAFGLPVTISSDYIEQNRKLHSCRPDYGASGSKRADTVAKLAKSIKARTVLDYGCGKGELGLHLPFPIWEYDPAIPGKDMPPRPAELVVCSDVLEHIEPEYIENVLIDLARVTRRLAYLVIHTGPSAKTLPDGRNTHLIQQGKEWWTERLTKYFHLAENSVIEKRPMLHVIATPKTQEKP